MSSSSIEARPVGSFGEVDLVSPGIFGSTVVQNGKLIHLRMELLTVENEERWDLFKSLTGRLCGSSRGIFTCLVADVCEDDRLTPFSEVVQYTGFSEKEHEAFLKEILNAKERTDGKIYDLITKTETGSVHMCAYTKEVTKTSEALNSTYKNGRYIVYATRNSKFTIPPVKPTSDNTLKNWIESYKDILICAGTDFSYDETSFHTRGIFRNPYWVLKGKHSGLSMLLHGFTGMVAKAYFPTKERLTVFPVGSMTCIFQKFLSRDEAFYQGGETTTMVDVLDIKVTPRSGQRGPVFITVPALVRIFNTLIAHKDP